MNVQVTNGTRGGAFILDTTLVAGNWTEIRVITATKFHTLSGNISGALANTTEGSATTVPANAILKGKFAAIKLHSGVIQALE